MDNYTIGGMITDASQIESLFSSEIDDSQEKKTTTGAETEHPDNEEQEDVTETEVPTVEDLFGKEESESEKVGNEDEDKEDKKEPTSKTETGSSPKNPYSSIAYAMYEEGVLSTLSEDDLKDVKDGQSLVAVMDKYVESRFDEQQKRVLDALNVGIEKTAIQQYESTIQALDNVSSESLEAETTEGENLRKAVIYQYYINKGESQERAQKMVDRAFSSGTDVEDAKDFIEELKTSTKEKYTALIEEGKRQAREAKKQQEAALTKAKKAILEDENILGGVAVDKVTRQKALDYWLKPVHKREDGTYQSELQKYATEHPDEFQMKIALLFAMSDKFKSPEKIAGETIKKAKKKAMLELEDVVNSTRRTASGGIDLNFKDNDTNFNTFQLASPDMWRH